MTYKLFPDIAFICVKTELAANYKNQNLKIGKMITTIKRVIIIILLILNVARYSLKNLSVFSSVYVSNHLFFSPERNVITERHSVPPNSPKRVVSGGRGKRWRIGPVVGIWVAKWVAIHTSTFGDPPSVIHFCTFIILFCRFSN